MRARRLVGLALGVAVATIALAPQRRVEAGCNAVPPSARRYPSTTGVLNRRLVAPWTAPNAQATPGPDDVVEIELPMACVSGPVFTPGISVEIEFQRPVPGATASPSWMQMTTDRLLRFTVPDTGRAGPVNVVVKTSANVKVAEVGPLYQETSSCLPGPREETFGQLTVLPPANDLRALAAGKAPLVMTVDGNGGLLVPLAHPFPVPTVQALGARDLVALLERGSGDFQAFSAPIRTLAEALKAAKQPADATLSEQLVRTFTEHGRPLPVLVHIDQDGAVWGSVDVARSVLRVAPRDAASNPIQDLAQRLDANGRIVVTPRPTPSVQPWAAATSAPFLLADLRSRDHVVAWVRDERIEGEFDGVAGLTGTRVVTVHASRAGRSAGYGMSKVGRDARGRALLGTSDVGGAFLAPNSGDKGKLVAYALPTPGTPIPRETPANLSSKINKRGLAISSPLVFFGKYQAGKKPKLQSFDLEARKFEDAAVPAFDVSAVGGGCSVTIAAADRAASWHCRAKGSQTRDFGVTADDVALAGRLAVVAARPSPSPAVLLQAIRPTGNPGPQYRIAQAALAVGATAYCESSGNPCDDAPCPTGDCRRFGAFLAAVPSPSVGMLHWVAEPTPGATPAPVAVQLASDFVTRGGIIAFRSPRTSGNGKELFTLDLRKEPPRLCSTGSTATTPGAVDWDDFYEIRGNDVLFLTDEVEEGRDLNNDHKIDRVVLQMFNVEGCNDPSFLGTSPTATAPLTEVVAPPEVEPGGVRVSVSGDGASSTLFADEEGDGVVYPFDTCAVFPNPRQIDDDLDGLGDGAESCDPTYCTPYQPPPVELGPCADRRCRRRIRDAARGYLAARAAVVGLCLPTLTTTGTSAGDERAGDVQCRGTFAHLTENPPAVVLASQSHQLVHGEQARARLSVVIDAAVGAMTDAQASLRKLASSGPCHDPLLAPRIVRASAEAIAAVTRAASVLGLEEGREAVTTYVAHAADIMNECLDRCRLFTPSGTTLAARCLGHLGARPGHVRFVSPTDDRTARGLARERDVLLKKLPRADHGKGGDRPGGIEIACLGWRRAVDVALAIHSRE